MATVNSLDMTDTQLTATEHDPIHLCYPLTNHPHPLKKKNKPNFKFQSLIKPNFSLPHQQH